MRLLAQLVDGRSSCISAKLRNFAGDRRGNIAVIVALGMLPILGAFGMAVEASTWYLTNRAEQNAADAAVVAAANQGLQDYYANSDSWSSIGTAYQKEGLAVAQNYGFTAVTNSVTVTVQTGSCPTGFTGPTGFTTCFQTTVTKNLPLYFSRVVGYKGNVTVGGVPMQQVTATAYSGAIQVQTAPVCILATNNGPGADKKGAFYSTGGSHINLSGCAVGSNGGLDCTGSTLEIPYTVSGDGTSDSGCGLGNVSISGAINDPYASLASNLNNSPYKDNCSTYPGETTSGFSLSAGTSASPQVNIVCGNLQLSGTSGTINGVSTNVVNVTGTQVWVVENGYLDLNGTTVETTGSGGLTIIFTSPNYSSIPSSIASNGYIQDSSSGGGLDISSPPAGSGPFSGVTIYQDPTPWNNSGTVESYSSTWDGNSAKVGWDLSGVIYLPNGNFTFNGATNKAGNGYDCFDMVINSITSHGGSFSIFSNPLEQCGQQGSTLITSQGYRFVLIA